MRCKAETTFDLFFDTVIENFLYNERKNQFATNKFLGVIDWYSTFAGGGNLKGNFRSKKNNSLLYTFYTND